MNKRKKNVRLLILISITFFYSMVSGKYIRSQSYSYQSSLSNIEQIVKSDLSEKFKLFVELLQKNKKREVSPNFVNFIKKRRQLPCLNSFHISFLFYDRYNSLSSFQQIKSVLQKNNCSHSSSEDDPFQVLI